MHLVSPRVIVYSYIRMSSSAQIKGDSARRQLDQAREFAERHGYTLAPPLKDMGVSAFRGTNRKKGALGVFLEGVNEGKLAPGILVIEALDRLSREGPVDIILLIREILNTGTEIHLLRLGRTINRTNINRDPGLLNLISTFASLAHEESAQKSERIAQAYRTRQKLARQGVALKGNYHPAWLRRVYHFDGRVEHVIIESVAAAVRRVFELAAIGMGSHSIARTLNAEGVPVVPACFGDSEEAKERAANRRWYQAYVGRLTLDRRVLGEYQPKQTNGDRSIPLGDPIPGHFPAIISQELWDQVQAAKHPKHGAKTGGRKLQISNLFTAGLAKCDHCGSPMRILGRWNEQKTAQRLYLRCGANMTGGDCDNRRTPRYEWFEEKFLKALPGIPWRQLLASLTPDDGTEVVTQQIEEISTQVDRQTQVSRRLLRVIEAEDEPDPEILDRRREIQAEIATLTKRLDVLKADREELRRAHRTDDGVLDEATALIQQMETDDLTARFEIRQRLHTLLRRIVEVVRFGTDVAEVDIRGGYRLTIPLDKDGEAKAQIVRGGFGLFTGPEHNGVPVLTPDKAGKKLVAATMKQVGPRRFLRMAAAE